MVKRYRTKKTAEKRRRVGHVVVWRGPASTKKPGWYIVSRIGGKRTSIKKRKK